MARARNIKPAFFKNEALAELPFEHRLLFIGLWTLADRCGKLEDRPRRIKMEVFPEDDVDVDAALSELAAHGFVTRYEVLGVKVLRVNNFLKHQNPHPREKESALPDPAAACHEQGNARVCLQAQKVEKVVSPDAVQEAGLKRSEQKPCKGTDLSRTSPADFLNPESLNPDVLNPDFLPPAAQRKKKTHQRLPKDFALTPASKAYAQERGIDEEAELQTFCDYHKARGSVMLDWQAAWRAWCSNALRFGKGYGGRKTQAQAATAVFKQSAIEQKNKETLARLIQKGAPEEGGNEGGNEGVRDAVGDGAKQGEGQ